MIYIMVETIKENIVLNRVVGSKIFNISVEGDSIIPDIKPDILNAINITSNVCIYKKEILNDKIKIDGNLNVYIMYLADSEEGRIRGFNGNIDFSEILDFPGVTEEMILDEKTIVKETECKVLNGRKVNLKAMLEIEVNLSTNEKREIVKDIKNVEDLQKQEINLKIDSLVRAKFNKSQCKGNYST